jgi:hypothetical protein
MSSAKAGCIGRRTTVQVTSFPRPVEGDHSHSQEPQRAQRGVGTCRSFSQPEQRWKQSSPRLQFW